MRIPSVPIFVLDIRFPWEVLFWNLTADSRSGCGQRQAFLLPWWNGIPVIVKGLKLHAILDIGCTVTQSRLQPWHIWKKHVCHTTTFKFYHRTCPCHTTLLNYIRIQTERLTLVGTNVHCYSLRIIALTHTKNGKWENVFSTGLKLAWKASICSTLTSKWSLLVYKMQIFNMQIFITQHKVRLNHQTIQWLISKLILLVLFLQSFNPLLETRKPAYSEPAYGESFHPNPNSMICYLEHGSSHLSLNPGMCKQLWCCWSCGWIFPEGLCLACMHTKLLWHEASHISRHQ